MTREIPFKPKVKVTAPIAVFPIVLGKAYVLADYMENFKIRYLLRF